MNLAALFDRGLVRLPHTLAVACYERILKAERPGDIDQGEAAAVHAEAVDAMGARDYAVPEPRQGSAVGSNDGVAPDDTDEDSDHGPEDPPAPVSPPRAPRVEPRDSGSALGSDIDAESSDPSTSTRPRGTSASCS